MCGFFFSFFLLLLKDSCKWIFFFKDISVQCVSRECKALHLKPSLLGFWLHKLNIYSPTYSLINWPKESRLHEAGVGGGDGGRPQDILLGWLCKGCFTLTVVYLFMVLNNYIMLKENICQK